MRGTCITLYSTFSVKAGVKKSGKPTPWTPQEVWDGVGRCLGVHCKLGGVGGPCLPGLLHTRLHGERAVERYTAHTHPTTGLQSALQLIQRYTALYSRYTALYTIQLYSLYSIIQHYTALYIIQLYSLYSIQRYTITLCQWALPPNCL